MKKVDAIPFINQFIKFSIPTLTILPGILFGLKYASLNILSVLLFFIFVSLSYSIHRSKDNFSGDVPFSLILKTIINVVILVFLSINYSLFLGINLFLYMILINVRNIFEYHNLRLLHVMLLLIFHVIILNLISFYLIARFIPNNLFVYLMPLIIPILMYQELDYFKNDTQLSSILVFLNVGLSFIFMIFVTNFWALIIVLTIPLTLYMKKHFKIHFIYPFIFFMFFFQLILIVL